MKILFYKKKFNRNYSIYDRLGMAQAKIEKILPAGVQFVYSSEAEDLQKADVVIWDAPFACAEYINTPKPERQIWVGWNLEAYHTYPWLINAMRIFDISMTYELCSDVPIPYYTYDFRHELPDAPVRPKTKHIACWIHSNANRSKRKELLDTMMEYMHINCYGYRQNTFIASRNYRDKLIASTDYMFNLAFENSISDDFITEKAYDPLLCGSVPIYLGAQNIDSFMPGENCFINANGKTAAELIDELQEYIHDQALYNTLFEWKNKPLKQEFMDKMEIVKEHCILRLIKKINTL